MAEPGGAAGPKLIPKKLFGSSSSSGFPAPRALRRPCFASAHSKQEQLPREGFSQGIQVQDPLSAPVGFAFLPRGCSFSLDFVAGMSLPDIILLLFFPPFPEQMPIFLLPVFFSSSPFPPKNEG